MDGVYQVGDVVLEGWRLTKQIGSGGFGRVFEAVYADEQFGKSYRAAIKVVTVAPKEGGGASGEDAAYYRSIVDKMIQEIDLMYQLKGESNIVSYEGHVIVPHSSGIGWDIIIRMELLLPLEVYIRHYGMSSEKVRELGRDICGALSVCQKYNIIHRDIKEDNIFVSRQGHFKLGDFGIARVVEAGDDHLSRSGTYSYMAPEVYFGRPYGPSADLYSLGIVMYRLLNRRRLPFLPPEPTPITYESKEKAFSERMSGKPLPAPVDASAEMSRVILKAVAFEPTERYLSAEQMLRDLNRLSQEVTEEFDKTRKNITAGKPAVNPVIKGGPADKTIAQRPEGNGKKQKKSRKRKKSGALAVTILLIAVLAVGAGGWFFFRQAAQNKRIEQYEDLLREASSVSDAQPDRAGMLLQEAMELLPQQKEAGRSYAYLLWNQRKYEECSRFVASLQEPDDQTLLIGASSDFERGNFALAAQRYYKVSQESMSTEDLRDFAVCLGRLGQLDQAATIFSMLTGKGATADVTDYVLGETYYEKQDYSNAESCFRQVLENSQDPVLIRRCAVSLAECYRDSSDYAGVLGAAEEGLSYMPGNTVLMEMAGDACYKLGQAGAGEAYYIQAAGWFEQVAAAGFAQPYLYANIVQAYLSAGDLDQAEAAAVNMTAEFANDYSGYALRAMVMMQRQNQLPQDRRSYDDFMEIYRKAAELIRSNDDSTLMQQLEAAVDQLRQNGWIS